MKRFIMLTKNEIKYIQSLYHKKQRDEEGLFVGEGPKVAKELIHSSFEVRHVYATKNWLTSNRDMNVSATEVSDAELSRISNLQTPNEVLVLAAQSITSAEPVYKETFTLVLDAIRDPGNMGTILRIADWFGIEQIICSNDCVEIYNPKVVQSTMGSITRVKCWYKDFHIWKLEPNMPVFGALLQGQNIYSLSKVREGLIVIGNESNGIREPLLSRVTHPLTIPARGKAESLNAAVAAGIIVGCLVNSRVR